MTKIRFKHLKIIIPILLLCLPLTTIFTTTSAESNEVIMKIWLETPEKQIVIDEIISSVEELGFTVNTIYFYDVLEWRDYPGDWDLSYGGIMALPKDGDIFLYAFISWILNAYSPSHTDTKIFMCVDKLMAMYMQAMMNPDIVDDEFIADMVDTFQDMEERIWEKQYWNIFNRWLEPYSWEWGPIPTIKTEALSYNCLPGHVFADKELRLELNMIIDRDVFLDYHSTYNPYDTYLVYHLFQWLPFHDTSLPNCYPID